MSEREQLVAIARSQLGIRWQHQAALKDVACDCIGLILITAAVYGMPEAKAFASDPDFKGYGRKPDRDKLTLACNRYLIPIQLGEIQPADIVVMRFESDPQHFGLITGVKPHTIIHAHAMARKVVEHGIDHIWRNRFVRAWKFRGI